MNKSKYILLALMFAPISLFAADDAGFTDGNQMTSVQLRGEITVHCRSGSESDRRFHYCRANILNPREFSHFHGPSSIELNDVDRVELVATDEAGDVVEKSSRYNAEERVSSGRFNLWINTLFQTPLLNFGTNEIDYKLLSSGTVRHEGNIRVQVDRGEARTCRHRFYNSSNMSDCRSSGYICSRYFREEAYCR